MIKASFLPLLYLFTKFRTQGLFKSKVFASTGVTTQAQNQQELGLQKMQEPHEQRNRQEEKPRKHRNPQLHKSKSFAKTKPTNTMTSQQQKTRKKGTLNHYPSAN